ncbi:hypothetical protein EXS70_01825 [Candidatus Peribacteria bacterium]|nr:hypothetical protein [Candidatus Peribacteria bacterium]
MSALSLTSRLFSFPFGEPSSSMPRRASLGRLVSQSTALLMVCVGTLILVLALLILFHENANATKGYNLRKLENQRSILLLQQEVLNMQIAEAQSLENLQEDPAIAAMIPAAKLRYTQQDPVVAVVRE